MSVVVEDASTIHEILADLRKGAQSEKDKGTAFETLVQSFLTSDPLYAEQFEKVLTYGEWAGLSGDSKKDLGIDLVGFDREGGLTAIQCKFYAPDKTINKPDIDSFLAASGTKDFSSRLIVSTTDKWNANAEAMLDTAHPKVARIGLADLQESRVEWALLHEIKKFQKLKLKAPKQLRPHQRDAIDDVVAGFATSARGKLIMACGTGKTFTSLKLVEETVTPGQRVLFLAPSISLVSQTLREWSSEHQTPMRFFAVCSDSTVGKRRAAADQFEDISAHDLVIPATTDAASLAAATTKDAAVDHITVVFSTYQSIDVVGAAQKAGLGEFDLIICDEAHRTTGVNLGTTDESSFTKVHSDTNVAGKRRLYMTATPRIYGEDAKKKADEGSIPIASMDDESLFGPDFHQLDFGTAVDRELLSDYKVIILNISEDYASRALQSQLADENYEINLDDAAKLVGCWNALAKRSDTGDFDADIVPMRRAVAFAASIKLSTNIADAFGEVSKELVGQASDGTQLVVEAHHVDGTQNALHRNNELAWLRSEGGEHTCRILSNARCLSEGVDVPALDAVLFLHPRNSIVDVVQSVGRVMRRADGKKFGYVIIPVAIPAGIEPASALNNHKRYKVVWDVLRALRSHDSRLEAEINTLDPTKPNSRIKVANIGRETGGEANPDAKPSQHQGALDFGEAPEWREAVLARLVKNVGQRMYWDTWGKQVADVVERTTVRIATLLEAHPEADTEFEKFLTGLRGNLNESISRDEAISMLAQHMVTRPIFRALFENYDFVQHNAVAQVMEHMLAVLDEGNLATENRDLEKFYDSVRTRVKNIDDDARMRFVNELYEKFFKLAFPKTASQLGIVYTPVEIVDFIIRSVEHVLNTEFGASLSDRDVNVLDPFTGTGTFIVRLLRSGLIKPEDLLYKYTNELHCNEILLLAYYIAVINIEATFHALHGGDYVPFTGAVLADTFQSEEEGDTLDEEVFTSNNQRLQRQRQLPIRVIIGNPPYSVGQDSQNDGAANFKYPTLDKAIEETYVARSSASLTKSLYDSYIRAIRWASDRLKGDGVIGFVTNGGFLDSNSADGLRKTLADEFTTIYVFNLRGNQRTAGELSRREGGKVFGAGSRNTVTITLLVKQSAAIGQARVLYNDIGDYLTAEQKLKLVESSDLDSLEWVSLEPNKSGDWLNQRSADFMQFAPLVADGAPDHAVFRSRSSGVKTNRDAWAYNFSQHDLAANMARMIDFYNTQVALAADGVQDVAMGDRRRRINSQIDRDAAKISWDGTLEDDLVRQKRATFDDARLRPGQYRPFAKQWLYLDRQLNNSVYQMPRMFPDQLQNFGVYVVGTGAVKPFAVHQIDVVPDLNFFGSEGGQLFPRYTYVENTSGDDLFAAASDEPYTRVDNITDEALTDYRAKHGAEVSKDDIFYYVYGLLHSPDYRTAYAADLKRMLPRIPMVASADDFRAFATAGRELADLHIGYESVDPWPLDIQGEPASAVQGDALYDWFRVEKMRLGGKGKEKDRSVVVYNDRITVSGIPEQAYEYMLGSRSGVEWVMDRYQVKTDKASGIVNDPNDWSREVEDPRYVLDLLGRVVTVSVKTVEIVSSLPRLQLKAAE